MNWKLDFIEAKYHLTIAERMLQSYEKYPEKRFIIGVINESAKSASRLVRTFLIYDGEKGDLEKFVNIVGPKYLDKGTLAHLIKILEIEKAQKISPIEFSKKQKIIFLIEDKYKILTVERLKIFIKSLRKAIDLFSENFKK